MYWCPTAPTNNVLYMYQPAGKQPPPPPPNLTKETPPPHPPIPHPPPTQLPRWHPDVNTHHRPSPPPHIYSHIFVQYLVQFKYGGGGGGLIKDQKPKKGLKTKCKKGFIKLLMQLCCKCGLVLWILPCLITKWGQFKDSKWSFAQNLDFLRGPLNGTSDS